MEVFFSLLLLLCFLLFSIVFWHESIQLTAGIKKNALFRNPKAAVYSEEVSSFKIRGNVYLIFQAALIISILLSLFIWQDQWNLLTFYESSLLFLGVAVAVILLLGLKFLMYKLIGLFFLPDEMDGYITRYFWTIKSLGFLLFFPTVIYIFAGELREFVFIVAVVVFFISRFLLFAYLLDIFVKRKVGLLYFFVYFCGTEIAPYILYVKGVLLLTTIVGNIIL